MLKVQSLLGLNMYLVHMLVKGWLDNKKEIAQWHVIIVISTLSLAPTEHDKFFIPILNSK